MSHMEEKDAYREEIEAALRDDERRIGDVWRAMGEHGRHADRIRDAMGLATVGTVHSALGSIDTLLRVERLTDAPSLAMQRARTLRGFVKRNEERLSESTKKRVWDLADDHARIASDEDAVAKEREELEDRDQQRKEQTPGIYVYTLPHYMNKPVVTTEGDDDSNPRTYLKVGMSAKGSARERMRRQSITALPEPLLDLRVYVHKDGKADYREIEKRMHSHLNHADHNQNRRRGAGKEWFLTNLVFIDSTASLLGLVIEYENPTYPSELDL